MQGYIKPECVEAIRSAADIVEIIGDFVELKKSGANWKGLSPFVDEKTPSFMVSPTKEIFKDFSSGKGGDAIKFLMEHKSMSYPEALRYVAEKYHMAIEYDDTYQTLTPEEKREKEEKSAIITKMMDWAVVQYYEQLQSLPDDHYAKKEIEKRGWSKDDLIQWQIGFSPLGSNLLRQPLVQRGRTEEGKELSLINDQYDQLQNRIVFPIQNHLGNFIGLAGRDLSGKKNIPKYINPKESELYVKDRVLYGLNFALEGIRVEKFCYLVEGYTDVIAMHKNGMENSVASCGTSLTEGQVKLLKRFTKNIRILFDNDGHKATNAGLLAAERAIEMFLKEGFNVEICVLPPGEDPDSMPRGEQAEKVKEIGLKEVLNDMSMDAILYLAKERFDEDANPSQKGESLKFVSELVAYLNEDHTREFYIKEVATIFRMGISSVRQTVSTYRRRIEKQIKSTSSRAYYQAARKDDFELPRKLLKAGVQWDDVKTNVLKYGLIEWDNNIFAQRGEEAPFRFAVVSNFCCEIIQHINSDSDEKSVRLVSLTNEHNVNITFDTLSTNFVEMRGFKRMVEGRGNFRYHGKPEDYERIKHKLYEEMGDGRLIEQLGWQPEGFWAFNNAVIIDGDVEMLDDTGCFNYKGRQYYIKSGNNLYANMPEKYGNQKRMIYMKAGAPLNNFLQQMRVVHREHSFNMILHTLCTIFSDIVYERLDFVPMMFLYGEASTGKDQLIRACQAFFGKPQPVIKMTGKANTDKGKIRKFAEFINTMVHMSEYKCVNDYIDEELKAIWDRDGYTRADSESKYLTEEVPILSTFVGTGNEYPITDSLITRLMVEEFTKNDFNSEEKKAFELLKDMIDEGVSGHMIEILKHRPLVATTYRKKFSEVQRDLKSDLGSLSLADRMINNAAALGGFIKLLQDVFPFPFTYEEWKLHIKDQLQRQSNKRSTGSVIAHFWDCFLHGISDRNNRIRLHQDFDISENTLSLKFSQVYSKYRKLHYDLFRENPLSKSVLIDKLKNTDAYAGDKASHRFGPESRSSAYQFHLDKTSFKHDILQALDNTRLNSNGSSSAGDEVPKDFTSSSNDQQLNLKPLEKDDDDLPF